MQSRKATAERWLGPRTWLATVLVLAAALLPASAWAQNAVDVRASSARGDFPNGIVFTLDASSPAGLDDVRLVYRIAPDGVRTTAVPDCAGGTTVTCTFVLQGGRRNTLIPGADVTYFWRLTSDGTTTETESQRFVYEDTRFEWKTVSEGNVTVHYYIDDESEARAVLSAARQSLDEIGGLLGVTVAFPVKVRYYATAEEMQAAIIADNAAGVVTLGEVVYSDTAMVSADAAPEAITRHEVAHIVVHEAVGDFDLPAWLNEGTAVYAQGDPLSGQGGALQRAIDRDEAFTVRQISSASAGGLGDRVELFYGQSYSLVAFLIDEYGEAKFAQLFQAFDGGATTADALEQVYGFDQDGLENEWRASVGLPPREAPTPDDAQAVTPATTAADTPSATSAAGDGAPIALLVGIGALTVLLAGALVWVGVYFARRG